MKKLILFLFLVLLTFQANATSNSVDNDEDLTQMYIQTKAKTGDGIYSILRRYQLSIGSCNFDKFLDLNKLTSKSPIFSGRKYKIPVLTYKYDGNSITSSINRDDQDLASDIEKYNKIVTAKKIKDSAFTSDHNLWVPHNYILCESSKKSKKSTKHKNIKTEKLFGKTKANYEILDNSLSGQVYYVVSGHGGPDPGAIHNAGSPKCLCEDEYAYDVSLRLYRNLKQRGAIVHMIIQDENDGIRDGTLLHCDRDEKCLNEGKIPLNQLKRLKQRVNSVNNLHKKYKNEGVKKQKVVVVHVDSRPKGQRQDVFFLYSKGSKKGKKMANNLLDTFTNKYKKHRKGGNYDGEIVERNLYVLRNTHPPAVYVELANIKNPRDQKRITRADNRQALADWLYEGLIRQ